MAHIIIHEVIVDLDEATNEAVLIVHWTGGRHTEVRVARVKTGRYPADRQPNAVEMIRKLAGESQDRELAITMNRMRCKPADGATWTTVRVKEMRERLGIPAFDPAAARTATISVDETAARLGICVSSVHRLIKAGVLPARQTLPAAPWQVPLDALDTEGVKTGVREIVARRPRNFSYLQREKTLLLPGFEKEEA